MAELNVGVIGCGAAGSVHLACWNNLVGVRIAAICDADGNAAARAAAQYDGASAFTNLRDLLQSGRFDIIDICTPTSEHPEAVSLALRAGANVLCDKPLALTSDDARALVLLAHERERLLMTAFPHRFHPPLLFAKELVDNDDIGRVTMFRCRFSGYMEAAGMDEQGVAEQAGVGALLDTASSGIDLFRYFCGEAASVEGRLAHVNPNIKVEDTVALLLTGEGGALGVVEVSWSQPGGRSVVEIYGTAGACLVDYDTGLIRYLTADQPFYQNREEGGPNRYERLIAHFADAVRGLQTPLVTGEDGLRALELCQAVYRQNERGA